MTALPWAAAAAAWIAVPGILWHHRRRLLAPARTTPNPRDAALAEWCRHMSLTVVTVTGSVFSTTFAELQASEVSEFRNWNVPLQVTVWSTLAEPELLDEVPATLTPDDE